MARIISLNEFYQHVFGDWASLRSANITSSFRSNAPEGKKKRSWKKREEGKLNVNAEKNVKSVEKKTKKEINLDVMASDINSILIKNEKALKQQLFSFIHANNNLSLIFRYTLRELNASALEILLFDNNTDNLNLPENINYEPYRFPSDAEIKKNFQALCDKYGYFTPEESKKIEESFVQLFKGCKLFADYVECNNEIKMSLPICTRINHWFF